MTGRTRTTLFAAALAALLLAVPAGLSAAADTFVIKARRIYTASDGVIENGVILVEGGKIAYVGTSAPPVAAGTPEVRAEVVLPGLVDIHSHLGVYSVPDVTENQDGNEMTTPLTPEVRALDSFNFEDPALKAALAGGVTTIVSRPGSANVIGGTSVAVKLKCSTPTRMVLKEVCDLKMTIEGNPVAFHSAQNRMPMTLMAAYFLARKSFIEAQDYMAAWERYEKNKAAGKDVLPPKRDLGMEPLVMALKREIPIHVHTCTASEIMSCIRLAEEFNLRLTMAPCNFAFVLANELRNRKDIHFNVGPAWFTTYYDDPSKIRNLAAILADAGLNVSLQVDAGMGRQPAQQYLLHAADLCVRHGMKEEDALKAITIRGAEAAGLEDRVGSIEKGKDADFVFLDGDPFEWLTSVESVMIDGKVEYTGPGSPKPRRLSSVPAAAGGPLDVPAAVGTASGYAIKGGTILTMAGPRIENGTVLVRNGKIEAVGKDVPVPAGWPVVEAGGRVVMPGFVSPRSQVGISLNWRLQESVDELSRPVVPEMEVKNAIEPQDVLFPAARSVGLTTIQVTPGDMNAVGGQGVVIKTVGSIVDKMVVKDRSVMVFGLGAMAKRKNQMPSTRMGIAALLRENLLAAREYSDRLARYEKEGKGERPPRNFTLEALAPVVRGEMPVMVHAERQDDILTALRIADEFHLKVVLTGGAEAHKVAEEIRKRNIPVIIDKVFRAGGNTEDSDFDPANLALLARAGVQVSFTLGDYLAWYIPLGLMGADPLEVAAFAFKNGLSEEQALEAVTIVPAGIIGCQDRVGSLEPGKDADIVILTGHPFLTRSAPEAVFIGGKLVYRKSNRENL